MRVSAQRYLKIARISVYTRKVTQYIGKFIEAKKYFAQTCI